MALSVGTLGSQILERVSRILDIIYLLKLFGYLLEDLLERVFLDMILS